MTASAESIAVESVERNNSICMKIAMRYTFSQKDVCVKGTRTILTLYTRNNPATVVKINFYE